MAIAHNQSRAVKRKQRVRAKIHGTGVRPRLTVFRSNQYTYLQAIDDDKGLTVASANELNLNKSSKKGVTGTKKERAEQVATVLATKLQAANVTKLAFDRGSYTYHGRLQVVADALRKAGIEV